VSPRRSPSSSAASRRTLAALIALAVLAALAAAVGWLLRDGESLPPAVAVPHATGEDGGVAGSGAPPAPTSDGHEARGTGVQPLDGARAAEEAADWVEGNLRLRVVDAEERLPLPGVHLSLHAPGVGAGDGWDLLTNPIGVADAVSDADGLAMLRVPPGVRMRLIAYRPGGEVGQRALSIDALGPEQRREVLVEVPVTGAVEAFWGRVVDAADGRPVVGAAITLYSGAPGSGAARLTSAKRPAGEARSDGRGLFVVEPAPFSASHVRVEAEGLGPVLAAVTPGHAEPARAVDLELDAAAGLDADVVDGHGAPLQGAVLALSAPAQDLVRPRETVLYADDLRWSEAIGWDGRAGLRGLPAGVPMTVEIMHAGRLLVRDEGALVLAPGETARRTWRVAGRSRLTGVLLDLSGAPVPDTELWLASRTLPGRRAGEACYLGPGDAPHVVARARTDAEGRFEFADVPAGGWLLGPAPRAREPGEPDDPQAVSPWAEPVDVPADAPETRVTLRAARALTIRGTVYDPAGSPVSSHTIRARPAGSAAVASTLSEPDGAFSLGPLLPGEWLVQAAGGRTGAPSEAVVVEAGADGLALHLVAPAVLRGRLVGAEGEDLPAARVIAWAAILGGRELARMAWTAPDASFQLDGLGPGRYDLAARTEDGRVAVLHGLTLEAGAVLEGLTLRLQAGARLRIRYDGAGGAPGRVTVLAAGGAVVATDDVLPGSSALLTVPPGPVEVRLEAGGRLVGTRTADAIGGGELELRFGDG
jgi:hypothetical protein